MNGGQKDDNMEMWVFILVFFFVVLYFISDYIISGYARGWRIFRMAELFPFAYIVPDFIQNKMSISFWDGFRDVYSLSNEEIKRHVENGTMGQFIARIDNQFVKYFNTIPSLVLAYFAIKLFNRDANVSVKHDMESLLKQMAPSFPHLNQFINVHPESTSIDFYPEDLDSYEFSLPMTELGFATCSPPPGLTDAAQKDKSLRKPIFDKSTNSFDEELARKTFEVQLGNVFQDYTSMTAEEKRLYQLFRSKFLIKQNDVMPMILSYARPIFRYLAQNREGLANPKFKVKKKTLKLKKKLPSHRAVVDFLWIEIEKEMRKAPGDWILRDAWIRSLIRESRFKPILQEVYAEEIFETHAFVYTGLMTMIEVARESETLAPLTLRWLKTTKTRPLWYAINCPGKKVSFAESAGAFSHWLLEKEAKMAVPYPEVTEAVEALKLSLKISKEDNSSEWD